MPERSWVSRLYTVGQPSKETKSLDPGESSDSCESHYGDGYISSLLLVLFLLSVFLALSISHDLSLHQSHPVSQSAEELCLIIYMTAGCAYMIMYMMRARKDPGRFLVSVENSTQPDGGTQLSQNHSRGIRQYFTNKLTVIGLILFYFVGLIWDGFMITAIMDCAKAFAFCNLLPEALITVFFLFMKMLFMGIVVIFAVTYDKVTFLKKVINRYCIGIIGLGVIVVSLESFFYAYKLESAKIASGMDISCSNTNESKILECFNGTTFLYSVVDAISYFSGTINIEFGLMAMKLIGLFYFGMKPIWLEATNPSGPACENGQHRDLPSTANTSFNPGIEDDDADSSIVTPKDAHDSTFHSREVVSVNSQTDDWQDIDVVSNDENQSLVRRGVRRSGNGEMVGPYGSVNTHLVLNVNQPHSVSYSKIPVAVIISVLFVVPFVIYSFIVTSQNIEGFHEVQALYWLPMIIACILGFWASHPFAQDYKEYSSLEMLVIMCTLGIFCYDMFSCIAVCAVIAGSHCQGTQCSIDRPSLGECWAALFEKNLNSIEAYVQAAFMMHAHRVKTNDNLSCRTRVFRECLIYLATANIIIWAIDSFVKVKNPDVEITVAYYYGSPNWASIIHFTFPLVIFHRFSSFLFFLRSALTH